MTMDKNSNLFIWDLEKESVIYSSVENVFALQKKFDYEIN